MPDPEIDLEPCEGCGYAVPMYPVPIGGSPPRCPECGLVQGSLKRKPVPMLVLVGPCAVMAWLPLLVMRYNQWASSAGVPDGVVHVDLHGLLFLGLVLFFSLGWPLLAMIAAPPLGRERSGARAARALLINVGVVLAAVAFFALAILPNTDV